MDQQGRPGFPWSYARPRLLLVAVGVVVLAAAGTLSAGGLPPAGFFIVLAGGLAGGTAVMAALPGPRSMGVLVLLIAAEFLLLTQSPEPWPALSVVVFPANAAGSILGDVVREARLAKARTTVGNVWLVNGHEETTTARARASALDALVGWDSAASGRFAVQYNHALFEAVGSAGSGYIIHCTPNSPDNDSWRVLGNSADSGETPIRIPTGPAYAPSGVVVGMDTAQQALRGFFHHCGPDPDLPWTSGADVLELRFGWGSSSPAAAPRHAGGCASKT